MKLKIEGRWPSRQRLTKYWHVRGAGLIISALILALQNFASRSRIHSLSFFRFLTFSNFSSPASWELAVVHRPPFTGKGALPSREQFTVFAAVLAVAVVRGGNIAAVLAVKLFYCWPLSPRSLPPPHPRRHCTVKRLGFNALAN
ncbi:hypothetical protein SESBI_42408 [Sesbania bispinosa]|nr:hypothetical protein SESBI_42408 [Sesbania bispinosa]